MRILKRILHFLLNRWTLLLIGFGFAIAANYVSRGTVQMWSFVIISILLAQSINLLTGITGQISLGHAGYFAIGAYASALLMKEVGFNYPFAVVTAVAITTLIGALISFPAGRVREFYLAMMSLAFGLIVYEIVKEWQGLTGGVMGLRGMPSASIGTLTVFGFTFDGAAYFRLLLVVLFAIMFMLRNIIKSHYGRAYYAVHNSEVGAGALGISQGAAKVQSYAISAGIAGLAGALYAHLVSYLTPESFSLMRSIEILVMAIVGGFGSMLGQVFGATIFTYLPRQLQAFSDYQYIIYGLILTFSFIVLPKGIAGLLRARTDCSKYAELKNALDMEHDAPQALTQHYSNTEKNNKALLSVLGVSKDFSGLRALDGVSLSLYPGCITALVGPNGSGKTTLVNVISGIFPPSSGEITFNAHDISKLSSYKIARLGVTRTFQDPRNVPGLTVRENILMGANRLFKTGLISTALNSRKTIEEEKCILSNVEHLMGLCGIKEYADHNIDELPYGIQRLAEVVRALASDPSLLMLDEPAAGLSEYEIQKLTDLIKLAQSRGIGVLIIDHHMDFLAEIVSEVIVLETGKVVYHGDMENMRTDPKVIEAYLGEEELEDA